MQHHIVSGENTMAMLGMMNGSVVGGGGTGKLIVVNTAGNTDTSGGQGHTGGTGASGGQGGTDTGAGSGTE